MKYKKIKINQKNFVSKWLKKLLKVVSYKMTVDSCILYTLVLYAFWYVSLYIQVICTLWLQS